MNDFDADGLLFFAIRRNVQTVRFRDNSYGVRLPEMKKDVWITADTQSEALTRLFKLETDRRLPYEKACGI